MLERALLLGEGEIVEPHHVELHRFQNAADTSLLAPEKESAENLPLFELEKRALVHALEKTGYNQSRAAKLLKISRDTLRYRMKKYNLSHS